MSTEFQSMKHLRIVPPEEIPEQDGLFLMLEMQKKLNEKIYPIILRNLNLIPEDYLEDYTIDELILQKKEELTKEYLLAIIRECSEALDLINSKPWKQTKKEVDEIELKYEFIDIQHFINSLYDIWQMNRDEILGIFLSKYKENERRNKSGY